MQLAIDYNNKQSILVILDLKELFAFYRDITVVDVD